MAVVVEVSSETERPSGSLGRFTASQKQKYAPSTARKHDFHSRFASGRGADGVESGSQRQERSETRHNTRTDDTSQPSYFRRESSRVPGGGWFNMSTAAGGGSPPHDDTPSSTSSDSASGSDDSPDSSSASSESFESSESDSEIEQAQDDRRKSGKSESQRRHRRRQKEIKRLRKALAGVKIKPPFTWNGVADIDVFDQWIYEIDTWRELNGLDDVLALKIVVQFLSGEAGKFFMKHVAPSRNRWTMSKLYEALFDYCFPTDYKARLRQNLQRASQGKLEVRDYVRYIQNLAVRFPDVSNFQLVQIFWKGLNSHLRVALVEKGLDPEKHKLDKLVKYAIRKESAIAEARKEAREFEGQVPGRKWGRFTNRDTGPEPYKPREERRENRTTPEWSQKSKSSTSPSQQRKKDGQRDLAGKTERRERTNPLSKDERDKLRAEGRCFSCRDTGHESRNCPKRKTARAPHISVGAASVSFAELEQMAARARQSAKGIFVGSVHIGMPATDRTGDWVLRAHPADCVEYLLTLLVSYHDPADALDAGMEPEDRFTIRTENGEYDDDRFWVIDHLAAAETPDEFLVSRMQLSNPEWGISDMLQDAWTEYAALPPRPEWGSGFPSRDEPDDRHPAVFWLRAKMAEALRVEFPSLDAAGLVVRVDLIPDGYCLSVPLNGQNIEISHEDVRSPTFDVRAILCSMIDPDDIEEFDERAERESRRRQRRMSLMTCVVSVGSRKTNKGKQRTKASDVPTSNWLPAIEATSARVKDPTRVLPLP
ncbi:hypothetical protein K466DRAFT_453164, partial [Polyporus arcularius HHB13444]